jgi:nickel-dependent lactate racemase
MKIKLDYGKKGLLVDLRGKSVAKVFSMAKSKPVSNPSGKIRKALLKPLGTKPLSLMVKATDKVCIVISDNTRPVPNKIILPEIFKTLKKTGVPEKNIFILIGNGTHLPLSKAAICELVGKETARKYRIFNHDCFNKKEQKHLGKAAGSKLWVNKKYYEADFKIVTGFIEPHFMAGFSGGRKGVCPGIAGYETIKIFHSAKYLASKYAVAGNLKNNPCDKLSEAVAAKAGVDFLINVTLDSKKRVTGIFAGAWKKAHAAGVKFCLKHVEDAVSKPLDVIITSAGGYPLDRNFYQTVKGIVGASEVVKKGGEIIIVSGCFDGVGGEDFRKLMAGFGSPSAFIKKIFGKNYFRAEQWQVQELVKGLQKAKIKLFTEGVCEKDRYLCNVNIIDDLKKEIASIPVNMSIGIIPNGPYVLAKIKRR